MSEMGEGLKKRILAVDDDVIILTRISSILRNDYELITINSGMRALRYLDLEKPDLILLDIRRREECKDIPVIILTGVESRDMVVESAKLGIHDYLLKPFSSVELLKRVRRVFGQDEMENEEGDE